MSTIYQKNIVTRIFENFQKWHSLMNIVYNIIIKIFIQRSLKGHYVHYIKTSTFLDTNQRNIDSFLSTWSFFSMGLLKGKFAQKLPLFFIVFN